MRNFTKIALFVVFLFTFFNFSKAYEFKYIKDVQVGNEPVGVFYDEQTGYFHIFCKGTDKDFDSEYEPDQGDSVPSWWILKIDKLGEVKELKKVKEFPFGSIPFPFRPAFVPAERKIWINHYDGIIAYNLDNYQSVGEKIEIYGATSLDYKSGHLLISQSSFMGQVDTAMVYSVNQNKIMNKYPIGINLVQARMYQPKNPDFKGVVAISLGNFGSDSSAFHKSEFPHFQLPNFETTIIGNTANYLEIFDDRFVAIPVMMSNKVVLTDLYNTEYFTEITLGEPSWDGPSYTKFMPVHNKPEKQEYLIFITTYDGTLKIYQFIYESVFGNNSYVVSYIPGIEIGNKGEALDFSKIDASGSSTLVVANSVKSDYSPNNTISIITISDLLTSATQTDLSNNLFRLRNNYLVFIGEISNNFDFAIYDLYGNKIIISAKQNSINLENLPNGIYFAKVFNGNKIHTFKFTYVK